MLHNIDVFSLAENENSAYINYLHIGNGAIVQAYTFEYKKRLDESKEELLSLGIIEMRNRFKRHCTRNHRSFSVGYRTGKRFDHRSAARR